MESENYGKTKLWIIIKVYREEIYNKFYFFQGMSFEKNKNLKKNNKVQIIFQ